MQLAGAHLEAPTRKATPLPLSRSLPSFQGLRSSRRRQSAKPQSEVAAAPAQAAEAVQNERDERAELEAALDMDDGHTEDRPGRRVESASSSDEEHHDYNAPKNQPWNRPQGAAGDDGWKLEA